MNGGFGGDRQELVRRVRSLVPGYTPEWKFTGKCTDIGSALVLLYCEMFADTAERLRASQENVKIDFLNLLGAVLLPPRHAEGVVRLSVPAGAESGSFVPKGSCVISDGGISYETKDDVFVGCAALTDVYQIRSDGDTVTELTAPFRLFSETGHERQKHVLYLRHDEMLRVGAGTEIRVGGLPADPLLAWSYSTDDGFCALADVRRDGDETVIRIPDAAPPPTVTEVMEASGRMLRAEAAALAGEVYAGSLTVASSARNLRPDAVFSEGVAQDGDAFYPFGARFTAYNELVVFSDEALGKKHAQVTMSVRLSIRESPMESDRPFPEMDWKAVMKKSEYNPVTMYDITVEEVLWEYWNGRGWMRFGRGMERFFSETGEAAFVFECPEDIAPVEYGPVSGYAVRARVWSVGNAYRLYGRYLAPYCENLRLSYRSAPSAPQWAGALSHGSAREITGSGCLFSPVPSPSDALFLGFDRPVGGRPARLYFDIEHNPGPARPALVWECLQPDGSWEQAVVRDATEDLTVPGTVCFPDGLEMTGGALFGRWRHWLRVRVVKAAAAGLPPRVLGIHLNAATVMQREWRAEVWADPPPDSRSVSLPYRGVTNIEVMVDGIAWREQPELYAARPDDRHFTVDRNTGTVSFGDGIRAGRPSRRRDDSIQIKYATCDGKDGNLPTDTEFKPAASMGFVNDIRSLSAMNGGVDTETQAAAVRRNIARVRHRGRAVTPEDYEILALEACREIVKVRALPGRNASGARRSGCVTLVVLSEGFDGAGLSFEPVCRRVREYVAQTCPLTANAALEVVPARLLRYYVKVKMEQPGGDTEVLRIKQSLCRFFHPVTGHFDGGGWDFGQLPSADEIKSALTAASGDGRAARFTFYCRDAYTADPIDPYEHPFILPVSGEHDYVLM